MAETAERHLTAEDLASIATGQSAGDEAAAHLRSCGGCRQHLARTERVVSALAEPVTLHEPPTGVWERIQHELGVQEQEDPDVGHGAPGMAAPATPAGLPPATVRPGGGGPTDSADSGSVSLLPRREHRRWPVIAAAAAAGLVVGAAGAAVVTVLLTQPDGAQDTPPEPVAVGEAVLDPVTDADVAGRAEMVSAPDGGLRLTVEVTALPEQGYYEVWLRDEQASRLMSLGTVSGESTTLPVPAGTDLERFPVVDVSQEAFDGNPAHSGVTLAAGTMTRTGDSTTP